MTRRLSLRRILIAASAVLAALLLPSTVNAQEKPPMLVGDVTRGRELFVQLKCADCHGDKGQTSERRLVPMPWPQFTFITFLRTARPHALDRGMPGYTPFSAAQLADIYAYVQSLKLDAPEISTVPVLQAARARLVNPARH